MKSLELFRLAGNQFSNIPQVLLQIPKLSWTSLANNPLSAENTLHVGLPHITLNSPELTVVLDSILLIIFLIIFSRLFFISIS